MYLSGFFVKLRIKKAAKTTKSVSAAICIKVLLMKQLHFKIKPKTY